MVASNIRSVADQRGEANSPDAIVIGAGPAGLACAATLKTANLKVAVIEQADSVGATWRRHYERLHLHTDRDRSSLPGVAMPKTYPTYPSRDEVVAYLESYAATLDIAPLFGTRARAIRRLQGRWRIETNSRVFTAPVVVVATGIAVEPNLPSWSRSTAFGIAIVHSSSYRNPIPYARKRVLVVGFGNSGGEIALDLAEAGVDVAISVRGPVQVIPRDLLGLPILSWVIAFRHMPARFVDAMTAPILRLACGSIEQLGLARAPKGPRQMMEEDGRVPLIDIGTLAAIRSGAIGVRGAIDCLVPDAVKFVDGKTERFDAIVLATGFGCDLRSLLPDARDALDTHGRPRVTGSTTSKPGLYFCGQRAAPTGQLREITSEAKNIADLATRLVSRNLSSLQD